MRQRGDVFDGLDRQAGGLQGGDCRLAARAGAFHADLDFLQAELRGAFRAGLGGALGGERRAFAAALEADRAGRGKAKRDAVGASMKYLLYSAELASATQQSETAALAPYVRFCSDSSAQPWPADFHVLTRFLGELSLRLSRRSLRFIVAAIRRQHLDRNLTDTFE